ncbi:hypothetical protein [Halpernia sp. GG3]
MKLLFFILFCALFSCQDHGSITVENQAKTLTQSFKNKNCDVFFNAFPDTYKNFTALYGYDDKTGKKQLYDSYEEQITFLFECKENIKETRFYSKLVKLAESSKWEADAVGLFQTNLSTLIIKTPSSFINLLHNENKIEVIKFWHFVFDGSNKNDKQNNEKFKLIYSKIYNLDRAQAYLIKEEFKKMYKTR